MDKSIAIFAASVFGLSTAVGVGLSLQTQTQVTSETVAHQEMVDSHIWENWLQSTRPLSPSGMTAADAQKICSDLESASWFMDVSVLMQGMLFTSDDPNAHFDAAVIKSYCPDFF